MEWSRVQQVTLCSTHVFIKCTIYMEMFALRYGCILHIMAQITESMSNKIEKFTIGTCKYINVVQQTNYFYYNFF